VTTVLDELARWDGDRLDRLLRLRPELVGAASLAQLAQLLTRPDVVRTGVHDLPADLRQVLEAVVVVGPSCTLDDLVALDPTVDRDELAHRVDALRDRFVLRPSAAQLLPVGPVGQALRHPLGLGRSVVECSTLTPYGELVELVQRLGAPRPRSAAAARLALRDAYADTAALAASFAGLPPGALALLRRADEDGPVLSVPGVDPYQGLLPDDDDVVVLVLAGLLAPVGVARVELPLEVGLALRHPAGARWQLSAPVVRTAPVAPEASEAATAQAVFGLLERVDAVVAALEARPAPLLASGGVGVKELRTLGAGGDPAPVSTVLWLLDRLGLVEQRRKDVRVSTAEVAWSEQDDAERWTDLVRAWLSSDHLPPPGPGSDRRPKPVLGLSWEPRLPAARLQLVSLLATHRDGACDVTGWLRRWAWRWPVERLTASDERGRLRDAALRADLLGEAELLGLLVDGAPSPLLGVVHDGADAAASFGTLGAAGVRRVHAQADLTLVCTGPAARDVRRALDRIATVETTGAATVWRISEQSLARAYDDGDTPEQVLDVLRGCADDVPQAMTYLVRDAHRRHGRVRVGTASSYVVVDDDALLADALGRRWPAAHPVKALALRRIAPGVAVSQGGAAATVEALRLVGLPAVVEPVEGAAPRSRSRPRRPAAPARRPLRELPLAPDAGAVADAVHRLRAGR